MIGMSLTNSSPLVAPTRARVPMIGTNPIAVAAPAGRFAALCLDMATSTVPRGRIEVALATRLVAAGRLGDRRGRTSSDDAGGRAGGCAPAARRRRGDRGLQGLRPGAHRGPADGRPGRVRRSARTSSRCSPPTTASRTWARLFWVIDPAALDEPGAFEARLEAYLDQLSRGAAHPGRAGPRAHPRRAGGGRGAAGGGTRGWSSTASTTRRSIADLGERLRDARCPHSADPASTR